MYENDMLTGSSLGGKTLCLTFDDGPGHTDSPEPESGPRTVEIARYLHSQGIRATFFMVGKFAVELPAIMREVQELGHLIANHTYDHVSLVDCATKGHDVVSQISRTDGLIRTWVDGSVVFFRPPYGHWDHVVARILNADSAVSLGHVGPIGWDIDGGDWFCWQQGIDPSQCADLYMRQIVLRGKGIILMHDCTADMEDVKLANRTLEVIRILVPNLKRQGYKFVRIDEIPDIALRRRNCHIWC